MRLPGAKGRLAAAFAAGALTTLLCLTFLGEHPNFQDSWQAHALVLHSELRNVLSDGRGLADSWLDTSVATAEDVSTRARYLPVLPDLSAHGYVPAGARLFATPAGPATFVLYRGDQRETLGYTVLASSMPRISPPALHEYRDIRLVSWSDGRFRYALSGAYSADALRILVEGIYTVTARRGAL